MYELAGARVSLHIPLNIIHTINIMFLKEIHFFFFFKQMKNHKTKFIGIVSIIFFLFLFINFFLLHELFKFLNFNL